MTDKFSESIDVGGRWNGEWSWERKEEIKNADLSQVRREHVWWGGGAGRRGLPRKATTKDESGKRNPEWGCHSTDPGVRLSGFKT